MISGKLIVIEGGDGSGKTVQAKLLVDYLKTRKVATEYYDFPRYYDSFHGETVAKFLRGEFGNIDEVSPYLASMPYALDRASVKEQMQTTLNQGTFIVANRYATSNLIYQAAKFDSEQERQDFINWVTKFEYQVNGVPKEDLVIYLDVPWKIGLQLTKQKAPRDYLKGHEDIHENHLDYRQKVEQLYLAYCKTNKNWLRIDCTQSGRLLSLEKIHEKIVSKLSEILAKLGPLTNE